MTTWDANNIAWWSFKIFDERFDNTDDYDNYQVDVLAELETNILDAVKEAGTRAVALIRQQPTNQLIVFW